MKKLLNVLDSSLLTGVLNYTHCMVILLDPKGEVLDFNRAFEEANPAIKLPMNLHEVLNPSCYENLDQAMVSHKFCKLNLQFRPNPGSNSYECVLQPLTSSGFLLIAQPDVRSRDMEIKQLAENLKAVRRDLERKKVDLDSVIAQADEVSHTDALTIIPNRKAIIAALQREVAASDRYHKPLTIFMADLDHFKHINDNYGHIAGDIALRTIAQCIKNGIREIDSVGRYGGEEFLLILPDTGLTASLKMAERILHMVRSCPVILGQDTTAFLTISIGIAQYRYHKENWEDLLTRADQALYRSKNNGRDQWTIANLNDRGAISSRSNHAKKEPRDKPQ